MNINRNNYETYFLLYIDNELSVQERNDVENFVAIHQDLAYELEQIRNALLPVELHAFKGKEALLLKNILQEEEENLLLLLDGALTAKDAARMQSLIATDPLVAQEWALLQQTKLAEDHSIVFEDKPSLYRHETGKVSRMAFRRLMAAAVIASLLFLGGKFIFNLFPTGSYSSAAVTATLSPIDSTNTAAISIDSFVLPKMESTKDQILATQQNQTANFSETNVANANEYTQKNEYSKNQHSTTPNLPVSRKNLSSLENINNTSGNENTASNVSTSNDQKLEMKITNKEIVLSPVSRAEQVLTAPDVDVSFSNPVRFATTTVNNGYEETGTDDKILFMDQEKLSNTRLGGLIRKVKRVIERNTTIKTGKSIQIAGFEIAAR